MIIKFHVSGPVSCYTLQPELNQWKVEVDPLKAPSFGPKSNNHGKINFWRNKQNVSKWKLFLLPYSKLYDCL